MHCKCFNISFWSLHPPPPPQKEGKRREIDEGLIIFLPLSRAETVEAWYTGDVFAKGLISMS